MVSKVEIVRPDDLLNLHVDAINLRLDLADPADPGLVIDDAGRPAYLVVAFPPQTIVEEAYFESSTLAQPAGDPPQSPNPAPGLPTAGQARARIGGTTRLVLRVPPGKRIPYTIEGLLDWRDLELSVSAIADMPAAPTPQQVSAAPGITPPTPTETSIELPYRLMLSPSHDVAWVHRSDPKVSGGHTELWHTRLAHRGQAGAAKPISRTDPAPLRAIWSPDYNPKRFWNTDPPRMGEPDADWGVLTAMTPSDRHEIVVATSAFHGYIKGIGLGGSAGKPIDLGSFLPTPFHAEQLILSALGGWLKSRGQWSPPMPWRLKRSFVLPPVTAQWTDLMLAVGPRRTDPRPDRPPQPPGPEAAPPAPAQQLAAAPMRAAGVTGAFVDVITFNDALDKIGLLGEAGSSHNLSEWSHIATQGRDHYVRIVYEGFAYRWHHRAALIKVTERKVKIGTDGAPVAYLSQQMFVVIRQPLMDYSGEAQADPKYGRSTPFRRVWLKTTDTPAIDMPEPIAGVYSFWIKVGNKPFRFDAIGEDFDGNLIPFTTSLIFVPFSDYNATTIHKIRPQHERAVADRACPVPGRRMAFAPRLAGQAGDNTGFTTNVLHFTSDDGGASGSFKFRPVLHKAEVRLPSVEQLLGKETTTSIAYYQDYLDQGFGGGNKTGLFAYIAKENVPSVPPEKPEDPPTARPTLALDKVGATFSADQAGGISTPNLSISGITRDLGPLAGDDLTKLADNAFNPADFFKDVKNSVKLFGSISLIDLLVGGSMEVGAPKVRMSTEDVAGSPNKKKVVASLVWTPEVQKASAGIVELRVNNGTKLAINGRVERIVEVPPAGAPGPTTALFEGELTDFTIDLLNVVALEFEAFRFSSKSGSKPQISVALKPDPLKFEGELEFVNELKKFIPPGLFGDGASLDVSPTRVKAGFGIGLPPVAVGVFSLQGVTLNAALELPFLNGKPLFDFGISAREHPFCLTVAFLGGGGFFHLQVDTDGVRLLEAALEFGAAVSVNLGVASGGVHIMAGIYFAMGKKEGKDFSILSGYLRMGGELSVLGLISVSLEFVLSFGYEAGKAAGRATLTVKVEVLFFSTSVSITVEKKFGGSSGDPRFFQVFETPAVWNEYASAFA